MTATLTKRWDVVITLSCASFAARNFGVKTVTGQVPIREAWVDVDGTDRPIAAHASLDLAALSTGNARRDRDLAKPSLLDTGRYAELVFSGGPGQPADGCWHVPGKLSGRGGTVDVELAVTVQRSGDKVHVHASTSFDRRDLGITAPRMLIGTRIAVTVDAVLRPA
jgi:polyisoprenoid-binding protein YceI